MATASQNPEVLPAQLPNHKVKFKQPMQRACNERNAKGKICGGHLKRWSYVSDVKEQACGDVMAAWGRGVEVYRCEHCKTLYLPNPNDLGGRNVAGYGSISDFGLTLPPKDAAAKPADAAAAAAPAKEAVAKAVPAKAPGTAVAAPAAVAAATPAEPIPAKAAPAQNPVSAAAQLVKNAPLKDPKSTEPAAAAAVAAPPAGDPVGARPQIESGGAISVDAVKTADAVQRVDVPATDPGVKAVAPAESASEVAKVTPAAETGSATILPDDPSAK